MIEQKQIMPLLISACPSFREIWDNELDPEDKELVYICLSAFARHLLTLHRQGARDEFPVVAEMIEKLHIEGDKYVREAATIGLLEGIQNVWSNEDVDPEEFTSFLLPESKRWWRQLNDFWSGRIPFVGATIANNPPKPAGS